MEIKIGSKVTSKTNPEWGVCVVAERKKWTHWDETLAVAFPVFLLAIGETTLLSKPTPASDLILIPKREKTDWRNLPAPTSYEVPQTLLEYFLSVTPVSVRLHTALYEDVVKQWEAEGQVILPADWRGIAHGKRGGKPMEKIASTFEVAAPPQNVLDMLTAAGIPFSQTETTVIINHLRLTRRLLAEGQPNWRVTLAA